MKPIKKTLAGLTALCLLCGMAAWPVAAKSENPPLRYGDDGKFRILVFTDTHHTESDEMITFLHEALDYAKPDLVLFLGDNINGPAVLSEQTECAAVARILTPVTQRGLPFAFVWGNHDPEYHPRDEDPRPELMAMYQEHAGCLAYDSLGDGRTIFNLPLYSSKNASKIVTNMWFFDSGSSAPEGYSGYDWVHKDQIDWYKAQSEALEKQAGAKVPSLAFQHIIVPEVYDIYPALPFEIPNVTLKVLGKNRLLIPSVLKFDGVMLERPAPPFYSDGEFDAWVERGDVFAAVFGHDHAHNFTVPMRGIDLLGLPSTTFDTDGADVNRGATLLILDENKPWEYERQDVTYRMLVRLPGSQVTARSDDDRYYGFWALYILERAIQGVLWPVKAVLRKFGR
jgi:hypothetical protein